MAKAAPDCPQPDFFLARFAHDFTGKIPYDQPPMNASSEPYDVIVCGGGHAGCEAALGAARLGGRVLLLSGNLDTIGHMSCNPAIGGVAKGQIAREIDALGGEMALNADVTGIQFRLLNASKGPAVQSPRAQCDKRAYALRLKHVLERQPGVDVFQATVSGLIYRDGAVVGCRTNLDLDFFGRAVVITTGTFLRGLMHVGRNQSEGGRMGDHSAKTLSGSFLEAGIELERLKTGTPPRLLGRSIDFSRLEEQRGDERPTFFAFHDTREEGELFHVEQPGQRLAGWEPGTDQVSCWIGHTSERTGRLVRENLHLSALYGGAIAGTGPRYCPSIEDKFVRFADKPRHMIFLEPEGRNTDEHYVNGLSTSLPYSVQVEMIRSIDGLERAQLLRPAYAVEYDFAPPTQLFASLESKKVENLFFAGQINGTSGYEEAACQGLVAGVNAMLKRWGEPPMVIERHEGYIGVLVDDLVTKGTKEPYRMFTSRAEYRLLLNHGSAELRLLRHAKRHGLVPPRRLERIEAKRREIERWVDWMERTRAGEATWATVARQGKGEGALPEEIRRLPEPVREEALYRVRYDGYLKRELRQIERLGELEGVRLPPRFDYRAIKGLRRESADKLTEIQPATLGHARRISGVNPADVSILMVAFSK